MAENLSTIEQTEFIPAAPELVYEALTDPAKHSEFTGAEATGAAVVDGEFTAWDEYIKGKHLKLTPGKEIVQEWRTSEWPKGFGPSLLQIELKAAAGGTRLKMKHTRVPEVQAESYRQGWIDYYWNPLRRYFESA
jgi:uncharacterized protein YndB with AHSA1/START domain